ncbi:membrane associated rhomboid family serine protease [Nocardioides cavernae]|uniref:Membrane associated rhomboid family serine protease n=1 Tax=Nocardioides cavernae TaxID=1921566 RepID=A0A7Y9H1Q3_9ACTN|nr:rhomboid family intramembrane serine protease [Nocardioides cavernae]NYE36323.1 membrane associated rhomboid family serine protease [Nocardioides cavernae]
MTQPPEGPTADQTAAGVPTCYRHPDRETWIRCQRCDKPICPDCMRDAAVGFQCPDCVKQANKGSRQNRAMYGGERSGDPRLTTFVLIGINAAVWLLITATGGRLSRVADWLALAPTGSCGSTSTPEQYYPGIPTSQICTGFTNGDGFWKAGVADGAWWQLITTAFTHVEIWHVAMNMFALFIFGPALEGIVGRARFLAIYVVAALASSTLVLYLSDPDGSTVGASGALFGLLGALLVVARKARLDSQWLVQNLVLGVVITVVGWSSISWQGHLGGFLGGAACAVVIAYAPRARRALVQWAGVGLLVVLLLALAFVRATALG